MKVNFILVLAFTCLVLSSTNAKILAEDNLKMPWNLENWRVFFSLDDTLGTIADYSFSFKLNMLRVKVTHAFQGAVPAYDIVYDYSKGSAFYFDNATSTCHAISSPQANLTHVVEKFLSKFEDQSTKGRNMRLYTANIREKVRYCKIFSCLKKVYIYSTINESAF